MRRPAGVLLAALAAWAGPVAAQTDIERPRDYALTNVRIVSSPGRIIERGTVVVRDGRITAVGANEEIPAGVITLDLAGRTVYPGLIDAASDIGVPRVVPEGGGGRGGGGRGGAPVEEDGPPPELDPGRAAADVWEPTEQNLEALRAAGITTVGLAFEGGLFPGRVSVVTTREADPRSVVLRSPAAQQVEFGRRRSGYPGTYIGALAYIEQSFLDTKHDLLVEQAAARDPATGPRPVYDPEHRALQDAVTGTLPAWVQASTRREIQRHIEVAQKAGLPNFLIIGAQEGYQDPTALEALGKPAIVSLNFPRPGAITGRAFELHVAPATGEDEEGEQQDSAAAKAARGNAAALVAAGVPIALASRGVASPSEFRNRILAVVEAGLAPEEALRALTVTPAEVLGIAGIAGTIEPGKLANLVVVEGDLFTKEGKIQQVFVEGERYDIPVRPAGSGDRAGEESAAGEWTGEIEGPNGMMQFSLAVERSGSNLTGTLTTEMGEVALSGEQNGADITLSGTATPPGMNAMQISITGRVSGDQIEGTMDVQGMASVPFNARRRDPGARDRNAQRSDNFGGRA
ncbi:MAG: amidohydrolase family protein [Longimicrobiales bacterium]